MPKIPSLPAITAPDSADLLPIEDVSVTTTKKITLLQLQQWFQALVGWITTAMIADGAVTSEKLSSSSLLLGYAQITSTYGSTTVTTPVDVPGLTVTVTVPSGGRKLKLTAYTRQFSSNAAAGTFIEFRLYEGATRLNDGIQRMAVSDYGGAAMVMWVGTPSAGSHTYKVSIVQGAAGTMGVSASSSNPAFILAELV